MAILVEFTATVKLELLEVVITMADIPKPLAKYQCAQFLGMPYY